MANEFETTMWKGGVGGSSSASTQYTPFNLKDIIKEINETRNSLGQQVSGGRRLEALSNVATIFGGLQRTGMETDRELRRTQIGEEGATTRTNLTQAGELERAKLGEEGATRRSNIAISPRMRELDREERPVSPFLRNILSKRGYGVGAATKTYEAKNWYDSYPDMGDYFKE